MTRLLSALAVVFAVVVLPVGAGVAVQNPYLINGVEYFWPSSQGAASTALTDALGDGVLSWEVAEPPDIVTHTINGTCPPGWSTYTPGQGRFIVGLVSGGTNAATVGTALTDSENRPTGQHSHTLSDPGHTHTQNAHSHSVSDPGHAHSGTGQGNTTSVQSDGLSSRTIGSAQDTDISQTFISVNGNAGANNASTTGIGSVNASGGVTGTNVPYVQLPICRSGV